MKKVCMLIFSIIYTVFALATLFLAIDLIKTAYGTPLISPEFWQTGQMGKWYVEWEMESTSMILSGFLIFGQLFCVVFHIICSKIGNSIMTPQRQYNSIRGFHNYTRRIFLISRIAHLLFVFCFAAHIWEFVPGGNLGFGNGAFVLTIIFLGLPGLVYALVTLPATLSILIFGKLTKGWKNYCHDCNYGSIDQFRLTDKEHIGDVTTTTVGGNVGYRQTTRKAYRYTYSCYNCNSFFKDAPDLRNPNIDKTNYH